MLGNEYAVMWLTAHAAVIRQGGKGEYCWMQLNNSCRLSLRVDGYERGMYVVARSQEHLLEICDVVLRLLAASTSAVHSVILNKDDYRRPGAACISAPTLAHLMEQCQSLKALSLTNLEMGENHCRVLGVYSRPDLEIELKACAITGSGASALAEVLGQNRGPTRLDRCVIDNFVLADGLRGNIRLKYFSQGFSGNSSVSNRGVVAIAAALRENKGLIELVLRSSSNSNTNDETWGAVCDSLKTHSTLEVLDLYGEPPRAPDVITSRTQALVDMMKVNTSIHTLRVHSCYRRHEMYRESVLPYLETNPFRPRLLAIQKICPIAYRAKVLGRALLATRRTLFATRTDTNKFWMLLSGNAEVAFPSRTTTIAAAANLPAPATADASTANVAAIAASVMSALTTTVTATLPAAARASIPSTGYASDAFASTPTVATTAVANVAIPSAGQKRKAHP
jgi:hypothetical protein